MARHHLTDLKARNAKAAEKPYRIADGGNLYLLVSPTGAKSWQYRYRLGGKPLTATLGKYPAVPIENARKRAQEAQQGVEVGEDPAQAKRAQKAAAVARGAQTFELVAADWIKDECKRKNWTPDYLEEVEASLRRHLGALNALPISKVNAPVVLPLRRAIERTAPQMAEKVERRLRGIMDYAVEQGLILANPIPRRRAAVERRHFPAVTDLAPLGAILREARAADPCKGVQRAHMLLAFCALRVSEVVAGKWEEFDLDGVKVPIGDTHRMHVDNDAGNWSVPRDRMKRKDRERGPHVVPLPPFLLAMLRAWREADGDSSPYVCPAPRDPARSITVEAVEKFYRISLKLGGKHSPHSWRSAFSTICREAGKNGDVIEAQLDHVVGTTVAAAYDRAQRLELRRELMKWYESTLNAARDGAAVLPMRGKK